MSKFLILVLILSALSCKDDGPGDDVDDTGTSSDMASDDTGSENNIDPDAGQDATNTDMSLDLAVDMQRDMGMNPPLITPTVRRVDASFVKLTAGRDFVCAQNTDASWQCWGNDQFSQIMGRPARTFPIIDAGRAYSCGIDDADQLSCWGTAAGWQVPAGTFKAVSSGDEYACAIDSNDGVQCFGDPQKDVIGNNTPADTGFTKVDTGDSHACGLLNGGTLMCWGDNGNGQTAVPANTTFTDFMVFGSTTCGTATGGQTTCWGVERMGAAANQPVYSSLSDTSSGACGIGPNGELTCWDNGFYDYIEGEAVNTGFEEVVGGFGFACGRTATSLVCWGNGEAGVLAGMPGLLTFDGIGVSDGLTCGIDSQGAPECFGLIFRDLTSDFPPEGVAFETIVTTRDNACGLSAGTISCWGDRPTPVPSVATGWEQLVSGSTHFCGRRNDGSVECWGDSAQGRLAVPANVVFSTIDSGGSRTCGMDANDEFQCWGTVGNTATPLGAQTYDTIGVGGSETCAVDAGSVRCWTNSGLNSQNRGVADSIDGGSIMCALEPGGAVRCWGDSGNRSGAGIANTPAGVFTSVSVGNNYACATQAGGEWRCWGGYVR